MNITRSPLSRALLLALLLAAPWPLNAGEEEDSSVIYPASFFANYDPVSVSDMLNRIPGVSLVIDEDTGSSTRRGLGSGENQILIDGRRVAGKENEGHNQLNRIAASSVDYIEIIRGTSGEMDVRSSGVVINIVLLESARKRDIAAQLILFRYHDRTVDPAGLLSVNGQANEFTYRLSLEADSMYEHRIGHETSILGDGSPNDALSRVETRDQMSYTVNANLGFAPGDRTRIHLNGLYRQADPPMHIDRRIEDLKTTPVTASFQREELDADSDQWEFGGDYEHRFGDGARYKAVFVVNDARDKSVRERFGYTAPGGTETQQLYLDMDARNRERIVRTSYTRSPAEGQDLEFGVERAQTILDSRLLIGIPALPISDATVEEMRYEVFAVHDWALGSRAALESSLTVEFSEIEQSGDVRNSRKFDFIRPKLDYRLDVTPLMQLRASITRHVSQLSFSDFVAASDTTDDDTDAVSGNPELVQEKSWQYEMSIEYRLADDGGVFNARLFYHDIEDVIDMVDISPSPTELDSAPGNIGDGIRYGIGINGSLRFGFLGLPDALLTAALNLERSEVDDPFLGIERPLPMRQRGNWRLGFQHDLPRFGLSYGFNYVEPLRGDMMRYDIDTIEDYYFDPNLYLYVEKVAGRVTVRLESINVNDGYRCRDRYRYDGHLAARSLAEVEDSCSRSGNTIALGVRGSF